MRVLIIDNSPSMGGSVRYCAQLASELAQRQTPVGLLASRPDLYRPLLAPGVEIFALEWDGFRDVFAPALGLFGGAIPKVSAWLAMRRFARRLTPEIAAILRRFGPDAVQINNLNLPQAPVLAACRAAGLPTIVHAQMIREFGQKEIQVARTADHVVCVSEAVCRRLVSHAGVTAERASVIYPGIDVAAYAVAPDPAVRAELGWPPEAPVACLLGRLSRWKGQHVAIAAWKRVTERLPAAMLAIVGTGDADYVAECRRSAEENGVADRVRFVGHRADVARVLGACDLLIHASCYSQPEQGTVEALGLVVLEAMAVGLPVVATAAGGPPEMVIEGQTGRLVTPGDPEALAAAVLGYLENPEAARAAGAAGKERAAAFNLSEMARQFLAVYQRVAGSGGEAGAGDLGITGKPPDGANRP